MSVKELVEEVMCSSPSHLNITTILMRDVYFYGYIIQQIDGEKKIDVHKLLKLVGTDKMEELQPALINLRSKVNNIVVNPRISPGFIESFSFKDSVIQEIKDAFYDQPYYDLNEPFELIPQVRGRDLIDWLNKRSDGSVADFIKNWFSQLGIDVHPKWQSGNINADQSSLLMMPPGANQNGTFLISVLSGSETMVDQQTLQGLINMYDRAINIAHAFIPHLIIVPSLGNGLRAELDQRSAWYCIWDLTLLSTVRSFEYIIAHDEKYGRVIGQSFLDFFQKDEEGNYNGTSGSYHYTEWAALEKFAERFSMDLDSVVKKKHESSNVNFFADTSIDNEETRYLVRFSAPIESLSTALHYFNLTTKAMQHKEKLDLGELLLEGNTTLLPKNKRALRSEYLKWIHKRDR